MSARGRGTAELQSSFTRQATILRKNLTDWHAMLRNPRGEDWPSTLGRLNAAMNQTASMDQNIDDVLEHFVYVPKKSTVNPQDIPAFLSTRLEMPDTSGASTKKTGANETTAILLTTQDPVQQLSTYEANAARLASEYEENMVRF